MYVESVPNRNSPPAVLLRESRREDGKIVKRNLANLSDSAPLPHDRAARSGGSGNPACRTLRNPCASPSRS